MLISSFEYSFTGNFIAITFANGWSYRGHHRKSVVVELVHALKLATGLASGGRIMFSDNEIIVMYGSRSIVVTVE